VCQACRLCGPGQSVVRACGNFSDTVCGTGTLNGSACLDSRDVPEYAWTAGRSWCRPGQYLRGFDSKSGGVKCEACPEGWAGRNGLHCARCGQLEEPYFLDRSSCVCQDGATMNASGACVCRDGSRLVGGGCQSCPINTYGLGGVCWACRAGEFAAIGSTACAACPSGTYRAQIGSACQACQAGWYAPDPGLALCERCNRTCDTGWRRRGACPTDSAWSLCEPCPGGLPGNASWALGNATVCAFECRAGFYHMGGRCRECSSVVCPPGRVRTACTGVMDAHCDAECRNDTKPEEFAHWEANCAWACDDGYRFREWDYGMFILRECVPAV